MVSSPSLKTAIGAVRGCFAQAGLGPQPDALARHNEHGAHRPAPDAPLVLVACSGGRDSLALTAVAALVAGMNGLHLATIIVDHQLQPGSAAVAARAARICESLGAERAFVRTVRVPEADIARVGTEAAARTARYTAFAAAAEETGAAAVCLAHTRDDQAETVLLGALRSPSPAAFAGMPALHCDSSGVLYLRPFLDVPRSATTAICRKLGVDWWDDPTNGDNVPERERGSLPLRSRVRQSVMPALEAVGGLAARDHLARFAARQRQDQEYLDAVARREFLRCAVPEADPADGGVAPSRWDAARLRSLPPAIRRRVCGLVVEAASAADGSEHRAQLERQADQLEHLVVRVRGAGDVRVGCATTVARRGHVIELCQNDRYGSI